MNHLEAKAIVDSIRGLSPLESLFLRGVAWHETNYGQGWKAGHGAGSFNMGAITTRNPDALSFQHEDVRNDRGELVKYSTWFKGYPTAKAGFTDLAKTVLRPNVRDALERDGVRGGVAAMHANEYFLGTHRRDTEAGREANIADYFGAVSRGLEKITRTTREDLGRLAPHGRGGWAAVAAVAAAVAGVVLWRVFR